MASDFVRRVIVNHLGESAASMTDVSAADIFGCLSRLQLECLIEQVSVETPLSEREELAAQLFLEGRRDSFKHRHSLHLGIPNKIVQRTLPHGQLALLNRSELEDFARSS
jgi:hypothetical protein